jgi:hypothetical protein
VQHRCQRHRRSLRSLLPGINDTGDANFFISNLFYTELILYRTYFIPNSFYTELGEGDGLLEGLAVIVSWEGERGLGWHAGGVGGHCELGRKKENRKSFFAASYEQEGIGMGRREREDWEGSG